MNKIFWLTVLLTGNISCQSQAIQNNCGVVICRLTFYDPVSKSYIPEETYGPDVKVWYKDSVVIQERAGITIAKDLNGREKRKLVPLGYTMIDLRTKLFYHYNTFSDTARLVAEWTQPDSVAINDHGGVWNFYYPNTTLQGTLNFPMADTLENNISYKRLKFKKAYGENVVTLIGYFRCTKPNTIFNMHKGLSDQMGCPLIRMKWLPTKIDPRAISAEILFIADKLTDEQLKVFASWEKNAKENPIQK